jgi:hypothetical protein
VNKSHFLAPGTLALTAALSLATVEADAQQFEIVSDNSGLVLDVPGFSRSPGTHIQQWSENRGANQQWDIVRGLPISGCGYEIHSLNDGMVLDVPGFDTSPTFIQQWPETDGRNQQWLIKSHGGSYEIVNVNSELVLDVPGFSRSPGTNIQQWPENDGANQLWRFKQLVPWAPSITVYPYLKPQTSGGIDIYGSNFIPHSVVNFYYMGIPNTKCLQAGSSVQTATPDATGSFHAFEGYFMDQSPYCGDNTGYVTVVAEQQGYTMAIADVPVTPWCRP